MRNKHRHGELIWLHNVQYRVITLYNYACDVVPTGEPKEKNLNLIPDTIIDQDYKYYIVSNKNK